MKKSNNLREQKRQNILLIAADLLKEYNYYDITLDLLADRLGTTKSNFYHYFDSKEQLYQEVFLLQIEDVVAELERKLIPLHGSDDDEALIEIVVDIITTRRRFNDLSALFNTTLTRNISDKFAIKCRAQLNAATLRTCKAIQTTLPSLTFFQVERFLIYFEALKNGLWAESSASEKYKEMAKDFLVFGVPDSFANQLHEGVTIVLRGIRAESKP